MQSHKYTEKATITILEYTAVDIRLLQYIGIKQLPAYECYIPNRYDDTKIYDTWYKINTWYTR